MELWLWVRFTVYGWLGFMVRVIIYRSGADIWGHLFDVRTRHSGIWRDATSLRCGLSSVLLGSRRPDVAVLCARAEKTDKTASRIKFACTVDDDVARPLGCVVVVVVVLVRTLNTPSAD